MSISVQVRAEVTVSETLSYPALASNTPPLQWSGFNLNKKLGESTTPPAVKHAEFVKALSGGAATIDLTSLTGQKGEAVTFSGLKVQAILLKNDAANGTITVSKGASNGYGLDAGGADFDIPVAPGAALVMYFDDELPDVSGSAKTLDLAGTGTQSLQVALAAG